jgi:hypothetical protein
MKWTNSNGNSATNSTTSISKPESEYDIEQLAPNKPPKAQLFRLFTSPRVPPPPLPIYTYQLPNKNSTRISRQLQMNSQHILHDFTVLRATLIHSPRNATPDAFHPPWATMKGYDATYTTHSTVWMADVLWRRKEMEKLPHYYFSRTGLPK